jgi:hypothetical protein
VRFLKGIIAIVQLRVSPLDGADPVVASSYLNFTCTDNLCARCGKNVRGLIFGNLKMLHDSDA